MTLGGMLLAIAGITVHAYVLPMRDSTPSGRSTGRKPYKPMKNPVYELASKLENMSVGARIAYIAQIIGIAILWTWMAHHH